jgi:hypothetical protein
MNTLDTAVGLVETSRLAKDVTVQEVPAGKLTTTSFYLEGTLVKRDQHLEVSEATTALLRGEGSATL